VIHILLTSFMNSSMLSEENSDNELLEDFLKLSKISKKKIPIKSSKRLSKKKSLQSLNCLNHMLRLTL
jgi:hypothetical protein